MQLQHANARNKKFILQHHFEFEARSTGYKDIYFILLQKFYPSINVITVYS